MRNNTNSVNKAICWVLIIVLVIGVLGALVSFGAVDAFLSLFEEEQPTKLPSFTASAETYKDLQKFSCWVDDNGKEVSTENPYKYTAKKEKQLTAVYKDFLTVESVDVSNGSYSATWNSDTLTYTSGSFRNGFGYITEPLQYGMTVIFLVDALNLSFVGLSTQQRIENYAEYTWGSTLPNFYIPQYNVYVAGSESLSYLGAGGNSKTIFADNPFSDVGVGTIKVVLADQIMWYYNGILIRSDDYDKTENYYFSLARATYTIVGFGYDKDTTIAHYSAPLAAESFAGKKITFLGDSITAGTVLSNNDDKYSTVLVSELNAVEYNMGISGTVLCTGNSERSSRLTDIAKIPTDSDYVFVMLGTNDFTTASDNFAQLGVNGSADTSTVYGAAEVLCKTLAERFADNKYHVFIVTPPARKDDLTSSTLVHNGYTLREFCEVLIAKAQKYGLQYIDMNIDAGLTADDMVDAVHPNVSGNAKMAAVLKQRLLENWIAYEPFVIQ